LTTSALRLTDVLNNPREGWEAKFKNTRNDLLIDDVLDAEQWNEL